MSPSPLRGVVSRPRRYRAAASRIICRDTWSRRSSAPDETRRSSETCPITPVMWPRKRVILLIESRSRVSSRNKTAGNAETARDIVEPVIIRGKRELPRIKRYDIFNKPDRRPWIKSALFVIRDIRTYVRTLDGKWISFRISREFCAKDGEKLLWLRETS